MADPFRPPPPDDITTRVIPFAVAVGLETLADPANALRVPFRADLVGDPDEGALAGGLIFALLDHACGMAVGRALRAQAEVAGGGPHMAGMATLDLRLDHIRPPRAGAAVIGEAACQSIAGDIAVVRGWAYEDDPNDPIATAQSVFMLTGAPVMTI